jgi:Tol biopolymer transport system component
VRKTVLLLAFMTAVLLASMVTLIGPEDQARAAFPGMNGKIVFSKSAPYETYDDGYVSYWHPEIWTVNSNGTNPLRLTYTHNAGEYDPAWSPNGRKIAFAKNGYIYKMNANGTKVVRLHKARYSELATGTGFPVWSPNSKKIAFATNNGAYTMNADGSNLLRLTSNLDLPWSWSPDGTEILFTKCDSYCFDRTIYKMNADGTGDPTLLQQGDYSAPDWSPDGSKIVFSLGWGDYNTDSIYTMNADGTGAAAVPNTKRGFSPSWSPNGGKIVFTWNSANGDTEISTIKPDGTERTTITKNRSEEESPDWQPVQ